MSCLERPGPANPVYKLTVLDQRQGGTGAEVQAQGGTGAEVHATPWWRAERPFNPIALVSVNNTSTTTVNHLHIYSSG